jgi:hypothetical protein
MPRSPVPAFNITVAATPIAAQKDMPGQSAALVSDLNLIYRFKLGRRLIASMIRRP